MISSQRRDGVFTFNMQYWCTKTVPTLCCRSLRTVPGRRTALKVVLLPPRHQYIRPWKRQKHDIDRKPRPSRDFHQVQQRKIKRMEWHQSDWNAWEIFRLERPGQKGQMMLHKIGSSFNHSIKSMKKSNVFLVFEASYLYKYIKYGEWSIITSRVVKVR